MLTAIDSAFQLLMLIAGKQISQETIQPGPVICCDPIYAREFNANNLSSNQPGNDSQNLRETKQNPLIINFIAEEIFFSTFSDIELDDIQQR